MVEHSAGAIIFRRDNGRIYYLLLCYHSVSHRAEKNYWDFPKGHIESGETEGKTVAREVAEETGITEFEFISKFREAVKYFFKWEGKTIFKTVAFYLLETGTKEVKISKEHIGFEWLPYEQALGKLTFKNAKEIIDKANDFLLQKFDIY